MAEGRRFSWLVRKLTVIDEKRREKILPLIVVNGYIVGEDLCDIELTPFDVEIASTEYLSELKIVKIKGLEICRIIN